MIRACGKNIIIIASLFLTVILFSQFVLPAASVFATVESEIPGTGANNSEDEKNNIYDGLEIEHDAKSVIAVEIGRQQVLYEYASNSIMSVPAASKLMTMLIACERLPLDTMVTISSVAADMPDADDSPDYVELQTGDKYLLEYLLLRMLYYNSDSAAVAIAEQIANEEARFVELMNSRAQSFGMTQTNYLNSTGKPVYEDFEADTAIPPTNRPLQYTTAVDLARLMNAALQNETFTDLFSRSNDQIIINGEKLVPMRNEIEPLWTFSENAVTGAFLSGGAVITRGSKNEINLITIAIGSNTDNIYTDTINIYNGIEDFYEISTLAKAGDLYAEDFEQTVDGETFGLVYSKTTFYIHPKDNEFLKSIVSYKTYGPHSRPIQRSMLVGQVVFELLDGTKIPVEVSPDRQILSTITILDRALDQLQQNQNLTYVIIAALGAFAIVLLWQLFKAVRETIHLIILVILDRKTRKT